MSSYFDEMGRRAYEAEQKGDTKRADETAAEVKQRVSDYLTWIERNALKSEAPKVAVLRTKFNAIGPSRYGASYLISGDLHEFGHDIGRAAIRIRGRGHALDNPYYPGHYEIGGSK